MSDGALLELQDDRNYRCRILIVHEELKDDLFKINEEIPELVPDFSVEESKDADELQENGNESKTNKKASSRDNPILLTDDDLDTKRPAKRRKLDKAEEGDIMLID